MDPRLNKKLSNIPKLTKAPFFEIVDDDEKVL